MLKKIFAPAQEWILLHGKCVGCGEDLSHGKKIQLPDNTSRITCNCGRIFIYDRRKGSYKRAKREEINGQNH